MKFFRYILLTITIVLIFNTIKLIIGFEGCIVSILSLIYAQQVNQKDNDIK